jgi:hypothetical protein
VYVFCIFKGPHRLRFCSMVLFDEQVCSNKNDANLKCVSGKPSFLLANKNEAVIKGPIHLAFCLQDLLAHASM